MPQTDSHLMRAYARQPVSFVRGRGASLWDEQGVEYLDAIAGVAVTSLGHAHPEIAAVMAEQAATLLHTSNVFRIDWQEQLGERLCALADMEKVFFCNSGAEANETALKLARLHGHRKQVAVPQILVMENAFHGRTLATLAATGNAAKQQGFEPQMPGFVRVPYDDIDAVRRAAQEVPGIVAVLVEPVQGEGGIRVASPGYLRALRELCDSQGWLLMLDEIQTGLGRTGAWFAHRHAGITPDVMTLAKALGNGVPIGACLARGSAANLFCPGQHGSTFGGNPLACAAANVVLDTVPKAEFLQHVGTVGSYFKHKLELLQQKYPSLIVAVRGEGLILGAELSSAEHGRDIVNGCLAKGAIINCTAGKVLRFIPPLIITQEQVEEVMNILDGVLAQYA